MSTRQEDPGATAAAPDEGPGPDEDAPVGAAAKVRAWCAGRLPADWFSAPADIQVDREEITIVGTLPDPAAAVKALAALVKPGGDVIVSTINRNPTAFAVAIVGAEYIARALPRGTHEYLKFIRPSELARWGREAGLELRDLTGITYNPFTRSFRLSPDTRVNYLAHFSRPADR